MLRPRVRAVGDCASSEASFDPGEENVEAANASMDIDELAHDVASGNIWRANRRVAC